MANFVLRCIYARKTHITIHIIYHNIYHEVSHQNRSRRACRPGRGCVRLGRGLPDGNPLERDDGLTVSAAAGTVHIQAPDGRRIEVAVYDIQGRCLQTLTAAGACAVDMSGKAPGIYIVKANDTTIKYRN